MFLNIHIYRFLKRNMADKIDLAPSQMAIPDIENSLIKD